MGWIARSISRSKSAERSEACGRRMVALSALLALAPPMARSVVLDGVTRTAGSPRMSRKRLVRWGIYLGTAGLVALGALVAGTAVAETSPGPATPAVVVVDQPTESAAPLPGASGDTETWWG